MQRFKTLLWLSFWCLIYHSYQMSSPLISAPLSDISFTSYNKSAFKKIYRFITESSLDMWSMAKRKKWVHAIGFSKIKWIPHWLFGSGFNSNWLKWNKSTEIWYIPKSCFSSMLQVTKVYKMRRRWYHRHNLNPNNYLSKMVIRVAACSSGSYNVFSWSTFLNFTPRIEIWSFKEVKMAYLWKKKLE